MAELLSGGQLSLHERDVDTAGGTFCHSSFWDDVYAAHIEDASYETPGEYDERRMAQQNEFRGMEIAGTPMPEITRRLEETVGYMGGGRYEWLQSFTTLRPIFEEHIGPRMPGWVPPKKVASWAAKIVAEEVQAGGKKISPGSQGDEEEKTSTDSQKTLSLEDTPSSENKGEKSSDSGGKDEEGVGGVESKSKGISYASTSAHVDISKTDAASIANRSRATERARISTRAAPIHRVNSSTRVLNIGCGTSTLGEDLFHAGWPNVLNMDFSKVCIDYVSKLWTKANWEAIQAKIAKDLAEEAQAEESMRDSWSERRKKMESDAEGFAEAETLRYQNKLKKRGAQLKEVESKCEEKIAELQSAFNNWKQSQPESAEVAPGVLTPEAQEKERVMQQEIKKQRDRVEQIREKAEAANAKSKIDLEAAIANHGSNVAEKIERLEKTERREHELWCQGRRDYMEKGQGLLEGLRHFLCDSCDEATLKDVFPDESFDLIIDKGTFDSVLTSTAELRQPEAGDVPAEHNGMKVDTREAPHPYKYGKHVRNMWRLLKQGGVYFVVSTGRPETRLSKIKSVGHGLKAIFPMWQFSAYIRLEKLGGRFRNPFHADEKHHWCYLFVKTSRKDVKRVSIPITIDSSEPVLTPRGDENDEPESGDEEDESSDDSSDGDLLDDEESEDVSDVSDLEESKASTVSDD